LRVKWTDKRNEGSTMNIKTICVIFALASTFALGTAIAQESDVPPASEGAAKERQRPDSNHQRQRRENMTDEQRTAARERWEGMSDAERQTAREKRGARGHGNGGKGGKGGGNGQRGGERPPKPEKDAA
jgi:hypothetical protein